MLHTLKTACHLLKTQTPVPLFFIIHSIAAPLNCVSKNVWAHQRNKLKHFLHVWIIEMRWMRNFVDKKKNETENAVVIFPLENFESERKWLTLLEISIFWRAENLFRVIRSMSVKWHRNPTWNWTSQLIAFQAKRKTKHLPRHKAIKSRYDGFVAPTSPGHRVSGVLSRIYCHFLHIKP